MPKKSAPKKVAAKKNNLPSVNLLQGVYFRVDGEEEKSHRISWDLLKSIGDNTQKLINKLAEFSLLENPIDPEALKLEFIGFYNGSAVQAFDLSRPPNLLFSKEDSYTQLNNNFSFLIGKIAEGNFQAIADDYTEPMVKNQMIEAVSDFTNSVGTKPFSIVRPAANNKFSQVAKIRYMTPKVKALLKVNEIENKDAKAKPELTEAVSKVLVKTDSKGRKTNKIKHLYTQKEAILSLKFDSIETDKRIYSLGYEAVFTITDDSKNHVAIENPMLDIYASGSNMAEAQEDLFEQFDYTYQRLNQFEDTKLSKHLQVAKHHINTLVANVKNK